MGIISRIVIIVFLIFANCWYTEGSVSCVTSASYNFGDLPIQVFPGLTFHNVTASGAFSINAVKNNAANFFSFINNTIMSFNQPGIDSHIIMYDTNTMKIIVNSANEIITNYYYFTLSSNTNSTNQVMYAQAIAQSIYYVNLQPSNPCCNVTSTYFSYNFATCTETITTFVNPIQAVSIVGMGNFDYYENSGSKSFANNISVLNQYSNQDMTGGTLVISCPLEVTDNIFIQNTPAVIFPNINADNGQYNFAINGISNQIVNISSSTTPREITFTFMSINVSTVNALFATLVFNSTSSSSQTINCSFVVNANSNQNFNSSSIVYSTITIIQATTSKSYVAIIVGSVVAVVGGGITIAVGYCWGFSRISKLCCSKKDSADKMQKMSKIKIEKELDASGTDL